MKLITNWRKSWRMFSQQSLATAVAIQGTWLALSDDLKASVPAEWVTYITITVLVLGAIGRLIEQPKVSQ